MKRFIRYGRRSNTAQLERKLFWRQLPIVSNSNSNQIFSGMEVTFIGTGSGAPGKFRGATSIALNLEGEMWMFDCGEGTQVKIASMDNLRLSHTSKIFVTHLHGDHVFGLFGTICGLDIAQPDEQVTTIHIYGPRGLFSMLNTVFLACNAKLKKLNIVVHELVHKKDSIQTLKTHPVSACTMTLSLIHAEIVEKNHTSHER